MSTKLLPPPPRTTGPISAPEAATGYAAQRACASNAALKKVSSTGSMDDVRPSAVGLERRRHQRRGRRDAACPSSEAHNGVTPKRRNKKAVVLDEATANSHWAASLRALAAAAGEDDQQGGCRPSHSLHNSTAVRQSAAAATAASPFTMHDTPIKRNKKTNRHTRDDSYLNHPATSHRLRSLSKPQLKRIQTAPTMSFIHRPNNSSNNNNNSNTNLADETLMNRALSIRENLRQYEMQELALEAERAAESGQERFVGTASKFIGDDSRRYSLPDIQKRQFRYYNALSGNDDDFVLDDYDTSIHHNTRNLSCRHRPKNTHFESSLFSKKKLRVTSLREFHEVIPPFLTMHSNIRGHMKQCGVHTDVLSHPKRVILQSTTSNDDEATHVSTASMASFSSFAMSSLRGIVDYVGRGKRLHSSKRENDPSPSLMYEKQFSTSSSNNDAQFDSCCGSFEFEAEKDGVVQKQRKMPITIWNGDKKQSGRTVNTTMMDDSSDDSSIEVYQQRSSPSSINGVLSGVVSQDGKVPLLQHRDFDDTPSIISNDATITTKQSVATFFSRMQHKFTRDSSDGEKLFKRGGNTEKFISNHFYTQDTSILHSEGYSPNTVNLKLDINADSNSAKRQDGFCISSGCAQQDVFSGCETVGNAMDVIFDWFHEHGRECDTTTKTSIQSSRSHFGGDSKGHSIVLHQSWMRTKNGDGERRKFYLPPRLAVEDVG